MGLEGANEGKRKRNLEADSHDPMRNFGDSYARLISQVPGKTKAARAEETGWHRGTVYSFENGKMLPPEGEVDRVGDLIFAKTGRRPEGLQEAKENYLRALETREPIQQLTAAKIKMTELIRRAEDAEAEAAEAYSELAAVQEQLAALRGGGAAADDQQRQDQEDRLLQRLARAAQALKDVLDQQQQTIRELRECAQQLVDATNAYLAHAAYVR